MSYIPVHPAEPGDSLASYHDEQPSPYKSTAPLSVFSQSSEIQSLYVEDSASPGKT